MDKLNIIVKMKYGSHLYGTDTPDSDLDYKGVFLPSKKEILLNQIPKSYSNSTKKGNEERNTSDDIDIEIYSLHYFLKLACEGQTVAFDMLHAPDNMIIEKSIVWDLIISHREKFYTKNLKAFIGYARRQAAKYGIKGSRLNAVEQVIILLNHYDPDLKLKEIWNELPVGEHLYFIESNPNDIPQYQICGKIFQATTRINYILPILERFYKEYGKRAKDAAENRGIDWKAISHALRAAYQTKQLLIENTITFPLKQAEYLKQVKQGKYDYLTEVVPVLEGLMDEVEKLSLKSQLPNKVNRKFWDEWLIVVLEDRVFASFYL